MMMDLMELAMRSLAVTALLFVLATTNARAENLEYCYKGEAAQKVGKYNSAIHYLTRCIDLGDLSVRTLAFVALPVPASVR